MPRNVTREEFDRACDALWLEISYQNDLPRRTEEEAKDVPGFLALLSLLTRRGLDDWYDAAGSELSRLWLVKIGATAVRAMIYCGIAIRFRD